MVWVALLSLVQELELSLSGVLVSHLRVASTAVAGVLQVSVHLQVGGAGSPSLDTGEFHHENII